MHYEHFYCIYLYISFLAVVCPNWMFELEWSESGDLVVKSEMGTTVQIWL
jgi:hypothetical protein